MNDTKNADFPSLERIEALVLAAERGDMNAAEMQEFDRLIHDDPQARQFYARYVVETVDLISWAACLGVDGDLDSLMVEIEHLGMDGRCAPETSTPAPTPSFLASAYHGLFGFFSQEIPFAMLMATFITGLGLLAGSLVYVSHHQQVATDQTPSAQSPSVANSSNAKKEIQFVGRVTGLANVQWANIDTSTERGNGIPLGRKYAITSGLMELAYDTGAKVILQGPCTYEVESNGGYLVTGKLTGKLKKSSGDHKSEIESKNFQASSLSATPNTPFTIHTSAVTVTDLGTEFGVDVDIEGNVDVHVFSGLVECGKTASRGDDVLPIRVAKDNAVRFLPDGRVIRHTPSNHNRFARSLPGRVWQLAAFFPMDGNVNDASRKGNHVAIGSVHGVTFVAGKEGQAAHFRPAADSYIDLPIDVRPKSMPKLTWGAWVRPRLTVDKRSNIFSTDIRGYSRTLTIDNRDRMNNSPTEDFRLAAFIGDVGPDRGIFKSTGPLPKPNTWTFVAAVYDDSSHRAVLYVEGPSANDGKSCLIEDRTIGVQFGSAAGNTADHIRVGRRCNANLLPSQTEPFDGDIDNVFIFSDVLGIKELETIRKNGATAIIALSKGEYSP